MMSKVSEHSAEVIIEELVTSTYETPELAMRRCGTCEYHAMVGGKLVCIAVQSKGFVIDHNIGV